MNFEDQYTADLGNGYFINPILNGDFPDPSILRVDKDYYLTHSANTYSPALLIWHSRDLVNWEPVCTALGEFWGDIWAPDFIKHKDKYYIYFPSDDTNWVISAPSPVGPWSRPVDLNIRGFIDPGHCVDEEGNRFLFFSNGYIVPLSEDGLSAAGQPGKVYNGWQFPNEWNTEGFCMESPKITKRGGYYYLTVAEGGTAGPSTSHMIVSARSKSLFGPWENSPYNPIIRTRSREEKWWSKGHGTLVDDIDGNWWIVYHAYENGYYTLGRKTLLQPLKWTDDGWFTAEDVLAGDGIIKKPRGERVHNIMSLSDDFCGETLGMQWKFYGGYDKNRFMLNREGMTLKAKGTTPGESSPMVLNPANHSYEVSVKLALSQGSEGGLILFYNPSCYCGIGLCNEQIVLYNWARKCKTIPCLSNTIYFKMKNEHHDISFYYSVDGEDWIKLSRSFETSGFHHNVFGGYLSLRPGIYGAGKGEVKFQGFNYNGID